MAKTRKRIRMVVEVSCPKWLTAAQARREVKSLIQHQAFFGHATYERPGVPYPGDEIGEHNFKFIGVRPPRD